jgi:endonuclease/exonuclease/phosphatase (EEP) superfamily protein YafD
MAEPQPLVPEKTTSPRRKRLWNIFTALAVSACVPPLLGLGARWFWVLELATHFVVYYAAGFLLLTIVFLIGRKWSRGVLCGLFLVWMLLLILPVYVGRPATRTGGTALRVLLANVHTSNRNHAKFLELVRRENPDVILAIETDQRWIDALAELRTDYPHHRELPRNDNFGLAFYSRWLVASMESRELGDSEVPAIETRLERDGLSVTLIGFHTLPPVNSVYSAMRNRQLAAAADRARDASGPVIAMGDLNVTPWSPFFGDFVECSGLVDSRQGFGIQPTWTGNRRFMRIPIDHVFVSKEIDVVDRRVGPDIGSDHFPVIVDLSIAPP